MTSRLQCSDYRFLLRRMESALCGRDIGPDYEPAGSAPLLVGCALTAVMLAAAAVFGFQRPPAALGATSMVLNRDSGALYVRIGDTWHPALNLASARLATATNANPKPVLDSDLVGIKRGPLLGIPGAPQSLSPVTQESRWAICDSRAPASPATTVVLGLETGPALRWLAPEQSVLVAPDSGAPTYLLHHGHRAVVNLADPVVTHALRLVGMVPRAVSQALVNAVPEAPPITTSQLTGEAESHPGGPVEPLGFLIPVTQSDATLCAVWEPGQALSFLAGTGLPIPAGLAPVSLSQADNDGPAVDAVYLPPGHSAYVRAVRFFQDAAGGKANGDTQYLITDTGVRFSLHDADAARDLGLPLEASPAPWPMVAVLPGGPELSKQNALVAWDTVVAAPR
ncbi:MAG: type VII secretion protein EccB [Mycobacteriaceae bacterium]|nr:type VII secretion protein EccB [Mycobacteriaceae bacterium]